MTDAQEYQKDLSVSMVLANLYSLFFSAPLAMVLVGGYVILWGMPGFYRAWQNISTHPLPAILCLISGIIAHELIHGAAWVYFGKKPLNSIHFGFNLTALSPYAHCREAMTIKVYRWGALLPGLLLGLLPSIAGLILGNGSVMIFGLLFTAAAGGDALILWLIRHEDHRSLVLDHQTNAGCLVLGPPSGINGQDIQ